MNQTLFFIELPLQEPGRQIGFYSPSHQSNRHI